MARGLLMTGCFPAPGGLAGRGVLTASPRGPERRGLSEPAGRVDKGHLYGGGGETVMPSVGVIRLQPRRLPARFHVCVLGLRGPWERTG